MNTFKDCHGCQERYPGCHGSCEKHKIAQEKHQTLMQLRRKVGGQNADLNSYTSRVIEQGRKRTRKRGL